MKRNQVNLKRNQVERTESQLSEPNLTESARFGLCDFFGAAALNCRPNLPHAAAPALLPRSALGGADAPAHRARAAPLRHVHHHGRRIGHQLWLLILVASGRACAGERDTLRSQAVSASANTIDPQPRPRVLKKRRSEQKKERREGGFK